MRLTRRGWAVVVVVVGLVAMGWVYGPRELNAVVTPLVVVLVAGVITTALTDRPRIRRTAVADGCVGDSRTVTVTIETDRAVSATVRDAIGDGLSAANPAAAVTLDGETEFSYELQLDERGAHQIGPLSISVVDLFGLVERRVTDDETTSIVVAPPIYDLRGGTDRDRQLLAATSRPDRAEFDHLREYERGDSLRDVHWKSAAKRPDGELVVTEYTDGDGAGSATIAAESSVGATDEMAAAAASVTSYLLDHGAQVGLSLPTDRRHPESGADHRNDLLGRLAVVGPGELADSTRAAADVLVQTDERGTRIIVDDHTIPFDRVRGDNEREAGPRDANLSPQSGGDGTEQSPSEVPT